MRRAAALLLLAGALAAWPGADASAQRRPPPGACAVPAEMAFSPRALPRLKARMEAGQSVRILAIGSSSTAGVGASRPSNGYPSRLQAALAARLPGLRLTVRGSGVGGEVASETLLRLRREVVDWSPHLVLWQVGTNDPLREIEPDDYVETLEDGVRWMRTRGVDVILVDSQYYRGVEREDDYRAFVELTRRVAQGNAVPLMDRYAIMRHWAAQPDPQDMLSEDRFHLNDLGYQCMAEILADGINAALRR